jgi:hypothetical protein
MDIVISMIDCEYYLCKINLPVSDITADYRAMGRAKCAEIPG